ncbi:Uncharacterized iron-regulated membrane protein [Melghirimyces thermohalophilus]|uniref:Uncharacterized iron-regulated membrane protein n=1 Tax=Melghirimyces thermohalophilus TaxID=1236220 RepID=A0A1G6RMU4_9BACL|nr:PepSY domain-containing protein [Melghirimyces thermohalophilus]SDD05990.1 Uncharacterized iron-regulated membrane protein [Melghirimyces thermohalophilus]
MSPVDSIQTKPPADSHRNRQPWYAMVWRWHFYAGIVFAPLIIFLAITGGIYIYKPQIESILYKDLYYVETGDQKLSPSEQIANVKKHHPDAEITSYKPSFEANRTSEIEISKDGKELTVFVNPYNGDIVGDLNNNETFMEQMKNLHNGELWGGVVGNRLVELAACWAVILIITGIYLWWPRQRKSIFGTLIPRLRSWKGKRMFWRDLHAVLAVWLSVLLVIQLFSGLMWTEVWGSIAHRVEALSGEGSPVGDQPFEKDAFPKSTIPTKEVADVPWAAENLAVPASESRNSASLPVEKIIQIAKAKNVHPGYKIAFPEGKTGVYTVFLDPAEVYPDRPSPQAQQTLHIDQYDGKVLADYGWDDYGSLGKLISMGIAFHQGEFGPLNQLLMLALVIGIVAIVLSGIVMWWKRRPKGRLGAPSRPRNIKMLKSVAILILILGVFFPLVGLSLIFVWLLDRFILRRIPAIQRWMG